MNKEEPSNCRNNIGRCNVKKLKELVGQDGIVGRPIRVHRQVLEVGPKKYAEQLFFGDLHLGHPACDVEKAKRQLDYCLKNHVYLLGMGDYIECGLRTSVGDSVYEQEFNPDIQTERVEALLKPLADAGLIIGLFKGNHEGRIQKETSVDIVKWLCKSLKVPYLGYACWLALKVGSQTYTEYALHGSTGSKYSYTKLKALVDISHNFDSNIIAMGHVHDLVSDWTLVQEYDKRNKVIVERKKLLLLTGHYLNYDKTYAQEKGYPIGKTGSPKVKLFADKFDIHDSM